VSDEEIFYENHRGGSGAVIRVIAICDGEERNGIFGSIETAREWQRSLGDNVTCVFSPYIVDDPDWGNEDPHA
tara:strand:+ start:2966 stop:3184 length:219 start_codon:yes stop_codon:yes gene_type:complete